jgi:hypothetical protein
MTNEMIITVSALVAAYVGVIKSFKLLPNKYLPLVSLVVAAAFVFSPAAIQDKIILISVIGLTASGVYGMTKNKDGGKS